MPDLEFPDKVSGSEIREARELKEISLEELAKRIGFCVSTSTLRLQEQRNFLLSPRWSKKLLDAINQDPQPPEPFVLCDDGLYRLVETS